MTENYDILAAHYGLPTEPVVHQAQAFLKPAIRPAARPFSGPLSAFPAELAQSPTPPTAEQWQTLKQAQRDAENALVGSTGA